LLPLLATAALTACAAEPDAGIEVDAAVTSACDAARAWLDDGDRVPMLRWLGELGLPPGACIVLRCSADDPALQVCVGTGKPPIAVECTTPDGAVSP